MSNISSIPLPQPQLPVGTVVFLSDCHPENPSYYWKTIVRQVLKRMQASVYRLKRQGYMPGMRGKKMLPANKEKIRQILSIVRNAQSIEVAGFAPQSPYCVGNAFGEFALCGHPSAMTGVEFAAFLLFRFRQDESTTVYIHPEPILSPCDQGRALKRVAAAAA